jgi:hypothetical protein
MNRSFNGLSGVTQSRTNQALMEPTPKLPIMSKGKWMPEYTRPQAVNNAIANNEMPKTVLRRVKSR